MHREHAEHARRVAKALARPPRPFAIRNARRIDARGVEEHAWIVADDAGRIAAAGVRDDDLAAACARHGVGPDAVLDARDAVLAPGYVDIHAHGGWGASFDDGPEGIGIARACHMAHGTTRQVLSLITNPLDVMARGLRAVRELAAARPDVLGAHLEGPFLAPARKGAHDPGSLALPTPGNVERLLEAADGALRQITIAPELPHALDAIGVLADHGVAPAIGHSDADYDDALRAIDAGATILTHMFNAMNPIRHREPGPIPAAVRDRRVTLELIGDGFHVQDPVTRLAFDMAPGRIALVTDAMAATDCPDGRYRLGALDVDVVDGHARLASDGAIAGSTLLLETAVRHAIRVLGLSPRTAIEAATLIPAAALGLDRPNPVTGAPIGLAAPGHAADLQLIDPADWTAIRVWCAGRPMP